MLLPQAILHSTGKALQPLETYDAFVQRVDEFVNIAKQQTDSGHPREAAEAWRQSVHICQQGATRFRNFPNIPAMFQQLALDHEKCAQELAAVEAVGATVEPPKHLGAAAEVQNFALSPVRKNAAGGPRLQDVVGGEDAKDNLRMSVMLPLQLPSLFLGKRQTWRGILLYGPPGTGKTTLARAVATEAESTFFNVSSADITSKYLGDSERFVKALFERARSQTPAIVFIDEIDSLLARRSDAEHDAMRRVKNEFFAAMDGFEQDDRVLVIGATNRPWDLDEAAQRRFEKQIYLGLPNAAERAQLFEKKLAPLPKSFAADSYTQFAALSERFSGSDIQAVVKDAGLEPIRRLLGAAHLVKDASGRTWPCRADIAGAYARPHNLSSLDQEDLADDVTLDDVLQAIGKHFPRCTHASLDHFQKYQEGHADPSFVRPQN